MNSPAPDTPEPRDLILLDAFGETSAAQKAALAQHLNADPALAAEHADVVLLASTLAMNNTIIPPIPEHVLHSLEAQLSRTISVSRRLIWLSTMAAALVVFGTCFFMWQRTSLQSSQVTFQDSEPTPSQFSPMGEPFGARGDSEHKRSGSFTGGRKRAVVVATECVASKDGKRSESAIKMRSSDARKIRSLLIDTFGFKETDIVTLVNEQGSADAIVEAINRHLIAKSEPGDLAVFAFSGHGTYVEDFDGDEDDGVDEALCPWDHDWKKMESWLTDDVIGNMMDRMSYANVLVIADACHSGTITRGADDATETGPSKFASMGLDSGFRPRPKTDTSPPATPPGPPSAPPQNPKVAPKNDGYLKPDPLVPETLFPLVPKSPPNTPEAPPSPKLQPSFNNEDISRLETAERIIREKNTLVPKLEKKPKGTLELEPLFEQKWFPLPEAEFRQRIQKVPDHKTVESVFDKLLKQPVDANSSAPTETDLEVLKSAEEFMKNANTYLPQDVEMMGKLRLLARAVVQHHTQVPPKGAQVLLAATAADRLGWMTYQEGSHFLAALIPALRSVKADTTFEQVIQTITPGIKAKAREAAATYADQSKPVDSPEFEQLPQVEGAGQTRVTEFMNGFQCAKPSPDSLPVPKPEPISATTWHQQSGDIALTLATDKTIYKEGDLMTVTITPDLDCHLRLYYLSADHAVHQIFPNKYQSDTAVKKGQTVMLPGAGASFEFRMGAPFGNEILLAVASSIPFTDKTAQATQDQLFQEFKDTNLEALAHRGISVDEKKALTGRALHLYRVEAKK